MIRIDRPYLALGIAAILLSPVARYLSADGSAAVADPDISRFEESYAPKIRPLLQRYCAKCHAGDRTEGDLDLDAYPTFADVRRGEKAWIKIDGMLESRQMPPRKARAQPSDAERAQLRTWVRGYLTAEARANAGDPGPVILRRLNNAEYNYSVRDLTGISSLEPTREFPVDGAAGEGFTNTGGSLSMSPALVTKYLDAAKEVASHAVLTPSGIVWSARTTRRDWTDERLERLRAFYGRFTATGGGQAVNLQGIRFDTNQGGLLPVERYLDALLRERESLRSGTSALDDIAAERGLSERYLERLWKTLESPPSSQRSLLLDALRADWHSAGADDAAALASGIRLWQKALWKFNSIGHIGRQGGPKGWLEPVENSTHRVERRLEKLAAGAEGSVVLHLVAQDAGDGAEHDHVIWRHPRLEGGGLPPVSARDIPALIERLEMRRREVVEKTPEYLSAIAAITGSPGRDRVDLSTRAAAAGLDPGLLETWLRLLDLDDSTAVDITGHFTETVTANEWSFVRGWGSHATPSVIANSSDREVRIPGIARPHGVVAHPSPTLFAAIGWRSPVDATVRIDARISDAHPECGNGFEWFLQHRSGDRLSTLWQGERDRAGSATFEPRTIAVRRGEVIAFILGPRAGSHACDLTAMDLTIAEQGGKKRVWDLGKDVSPNIENGNPLADRLGNDAVWHFYKGPMSDVDKTAKDLLSVPPGSVLAKWREEKDPGKKAQLARQVARLVSTKAPDDPSSPDGLLHTLLRKLTAPRIDADLLENLAPDPRFGKHPLGGTIESVDLHALAPSTIEIRVPATLAAGRTFVATGELDPTHGREGSVQLDVLRVSPTTIGLRQDQPIVVVPGTDASRRVTRAARDFRDLFPITVCYERIVPVDEVVTLTLFHREDERLRSLLLDAAESAELDRLWDELYFVSHEPFALVNAYEQIVQFATQDRPDLVIAFGPLEKPIRERAEKFRERLRRTEPVHLAAVVELAHRAWRRPLEEEEERNLRSLYDRLRDSGLDHEATIRMTIARVLTSPQYLYRLETPPAGQEPAPVSSIELATRLSYFLWSSLPDTELLKVAESGRLLDRSVLLAQTRRLLASPRCRRLAIEFGCQWLHVRNYDENDDKNLDLYPEFAKLRGSMYEETVRYIEDLFRNDGSVLSLLEADHTFLDESLARHYEVPGVVGEEWRRVDGVRARGRGGVLAMATILASQSGASRTSPILRGNWVSETLLGERLPRPPLDVPDLPDEVPQGLTARELIERHSSDPACAKCHALIDPYGFALEQYDAIGRQRERPANTRTRLADGREIVGLSGLQKYLRDDRRDDFLDQFCRKLLGYSLGREVRLSDRPLLEDMKRHLAENGYRVHGLVESIVTSRQFREIRGADAKRSQE